MPEPGRRKGTGLAIVLSILFVLALVMGPGPGLYLVNPDPADPTATFAVLGIPIRPSLRS